MNLTFQWTNRSCARPPRLFRNTQPPMLYMKRQLNSQEALKKLAELVRDLSEAQEQCKESKLSPEAFAVAWWLRVQKGFDAGQAERLAGSVEPAFKEFPHWAMVEAHERELRKRFYREFIAAGVKEVVAWAD